MAAFGDELLNNGAPFVEAHYRVAAGASNRALAGLSMGGGQSFFVGLGNKGRFGSIGIFSTGLFGGIAPPGGAAATPGPFDAEKQLPGLLSDARSFNAALKVLYISVGEQDPRFEPTKKAVADFRAHGLNAELAGRPDMGGDSVKTTILLAVFAGASASAAPPADRAPMTSAPGKAGRYCNPLPIEASSRDGSPQGVNLGDVTVVREAGRYYLFGTGGGGWVSDDLVDWKYQGVEMRQGRVPVAPHVVKYKGQFYLSGNDAPLYRAPAILGPYEVVGDWTDVSGKAFAGIANGREWRGAFDVDIFVDEDDRPYLYFPARSTEGIDVVPLDPQHLERFLAAPKRLFGFDRSHVWERYGEMNEYPDVSWIEGPWMLKRKGTYYLQYSASGTQWLTYATGMYMGKSPTGPFTYAGVNPVLRKTTGVVTGTAHGSIVEGPDGNLWQFYTIVLPNPPGGRRIGMDPVGFDARGNLYVRGPSEMPQWGPGVVADPVRHGDSGSLPLTVNKMRAMNAKSAFSSQRPGHDAAYAIDNSTGTWWEPAEDDPQPSMTVDLGPATEFDPIQTFTVDSSRLLFAAGRGFGRPGTTPPPPPTGAPAHRYKIEASSDGQTFVTLLDKTQNAVTRYVEFDELPPTTCRFVRLTLTDWPHNAGTPLGILEFTVFGKAVSPSAPPARPDRR